MFSQALIVGWFSEHTPLLLVIELFKEPVLQLALAFTTLLVAS